MTTQEMQAAKSPGMQNALGKAIDMTDDQLSAAATKAGRFMLGLIKMDTSDQVQKDSDALIFEVVAVLFESAVRLNSGDLKAPNLRLLKNKQNKTKVKR